MGLSNPSRETKFSGAKNADREMLFFSVQLTTSRIANLTRLIHNLLLDMCATIHTYIHHTSCPLLVLHSGGRILYYYGSRVCIQ